MKEKMKKIMEKVHQYNSCDMAFQAFGLKEEIEYDALVVAPSYTPYKLQMDKYCRVTTFQERVCTAGYLVEKDGMKIAWIKIGTSETNCIDYIALCAELDFRKMIFIGAVGALKDSFDLGDICTPEYSISGGYANTYLKESIKDYVPFEKVTPDREYVDHVVSLGKENGYVIRKGSVFCTASIALEYYHLAEIKEFNTDLIEMETSSFYLMADLLEIPSIALLVVSDNSATGVALVGRTEEQQRKYEEGRKRILPNLILTVAKDSYNNICK